MSESSSWRGYAIVFTALLVLLAATIAVAYYPLGPWNVSVALLIASVKTLLVMTYFMHLKDAERLNWVYVGSGFFFLLLLIGFTLADLTTRS